MSEELIKKLEVNDLSNVKLLIKYDYDVNTIFTRTNI